MTVADHCAELVTLVPMLGPALTRDNTHTGRGRPIAPLNLYNTDVLIAKITLAHEIPAAAIRSAHLVHEHWQVRDIRVSLIALPRFAGRMHDLGMATELGQLERQTRHWVRVTKRALGFLRPDTDLTALNPAATCPACPVDGYYPPGRLYATGSEAQPPYVPGQPLRWAWNPRVYCTIAADHVWDQPEWGLLEQLINQQRQVSA